MVTKKYKALIERFPLVPIKNDAHLDEAHEVAQSLMLSRKLLLLTRVIIWKSYLMKLKSTKKGTIALTLSR